MVMMWLLTYLEWQRAVKPQPPNPKLYLVVAILISTFCVYKIYRLIRIAQNYNRGISGEIVVGQTLERLRADGFEVFHDIPGEGFNVDHVVVGPQGVFTIETKTIGKPHKGKAIIDYDGKEIHLNGVKLSRNPIVQAKAQSAWLSKLILERTGKRVFVKPVVVFVGWYVSEKVKDPDVLVLNELRVIPHVSARGIALQEQEIKLISAQLKQYVDAAQSS